MSSILLQYQVSTAEKYSSKIDFLFAEDGVFSSYLEETQHLVCECIYLRTLRTNVKSQESLLKVCRGETVVCCVFVLSAEDWRKRTDQSSVWNCSRTQKPASLCHKRVEGFIINAHFPLLSNTVNLPDHIAVKHFVSEGKTENQSKNNEPIRSQKVSQLFCLLFLSVLFLPHTHL